MNHLPEIDDFLCRILRGENPAWPTTYAPDFAPSFLQRSLHHGVQALVFDRVRNTPWWDTWPAGVREQLTHAMRTGVAFDLLRCNDVSNFLGELTRRGIPFVVTKGEALARTHYANPVLRTRGDTDLFIDLNDINRVQTALLESGYAVVPPCYKSHQFMGVKRQRKAKSVVFDIHWRILNAAKYARSINFLEAMSNAVPVTGMDGCMTLGPVDALLLACMHRKGSLRHDQDRLIWLYDIHLLAAAMTPKQCCEFAHKAVEKNVHLACLNGLTAAAECFGSAVAEHALEVLATPVSRQSLRGRIAESNLGLLVDDWSCLPDFRSRRALLKELFQPSAQSLLKRYRKDNPLWFPLLYLRYMAGRLFSRMILR